MNHTPHSPADRPASPTTRAAGAWPKSRAVRRLTKAVSSGLSAQQYSERQPWMAKAVSVRRAG